MLLSAGGLNDVANALNELFTVGAFESVVISDPEAIVIADVAGVDAGYTLVGSTAVDPEGDDLATNSTSGNYAGVLSTATIDQAGEYFTFDIRGEGQIGFGLVHTQDSYDAGYFSGSHTYADPTRFAVSNSAHYGFQFSHWFHPTPNGSWTNYGANTSYNMGPAWSGANTHFEGRDEWLAGQAIKIRVGINENGYIHIDSLADDGVTWKMHARTSYPVADGGEYKLGIKFANSAPRLYSAPKVHLRVEEAPVLNFRYIESPDGVFQYPLFATEEEAEYYDQNHSIGAVGTGTAHPHVYADDPTNTTWYMADTGSTMTDNQDPIGTTFMGQVINYTEITSLSNSDLTPPAFPDTTITVDELSTVNYQLSPVDVGYVTTIGGIPAFSLVDGTTLLGTAPEVTGDNVANPSDTTTVTVYRTNSYGTSSGTLTINITNLTAPVVNPISGFTFEGGTAMIDSDTMADGSVVSITETLGVDERLVIDKEFLDNYVLPKITSGTGSKSVWIGFIAQDTTPDYTSIDRTDFRVAYEFNCDDSSRASNNWRLKTHNQGGSFANVGIGGSTSGLYDYVFINDDAQVRAGALVASQGHNASTKVFDSNNSDWNWTLYNTSNSGSHKIIIATVNTDLDLDLQYFNEYTEPVAASNATSWAKALDFSGSSERAQIVSANTYNMPISQSYGGVITAGTNGNTSTDTFSNPFATAVVFKIDGNSSNQHIWNQGEGAGSTDDNIYLRVDANQNLYFGWGRSSALNECRIATSISSAFWYGVYIAFDGRRYQAAGATAGNLYQFFDIRLMSSHDGFASSTDVGTYANWNQASSTTGGRMDRTVAGTLTIGGRGANRNFHGKVASFVATSLKQGVAMPTVAEAEMMITDPEQWMADYKVGQTYRAPQNSTTRTDWRKGNTAGGWYPAYSTQVWLMGDGTNDSYSNMIRNQVNPSDQNYTRLNLISMVSNDIQTVDINGLT